MNYSEIAFDAVEGLLYDPLNEILWAVGNHKLMAFNITGTENPVISEIPSKSVDLPDSGNGLDLNCYFGDMNKLFVSTTTGTYIYNKDTNVFLPTRGDSFHTNITALSNQLNGQIIQIKSDSPNSVDFYNENGSLNFSKTISNGILYRAKTYSFYYQTRSEYAIATYNIKGQKTLTVPANMTGHGWEERKYPICDLIRKYNFDIVSLQEPFKWQVEDMVANLGEYSRFGYSDDGGNLGNSDTQEHHHDIFYKTDMFEIEHNGKFWLAEGAPSSPPLGLLDGWTDDTSNPGKAKVCVWLKLKDKLTNQSFYVFCVHLYYNNATTRQKSAALLINKIPEILSTNGQAPVILDGDFNANYSDPVGQTLDGASFLNEAYNLANTKSPQNYRATFTGNGPDPSGVAIWVTKPDDLPENKQDRQIDHIYLSNEWKDKVISHTIIWDHYTKDYTDRMPSDHLPVMIELQKL